MLTCKSCGIEYEPYGQKLRCCRPCRREYDRERYAKRISDGNTAHREAMLAKRKRLQGWVIDYLKEHPCEHCGEGDIVVLEFDHIDSTTKTGNISQMIRNCYSLENIQKEIDKCRVLCCNCHRRRTVRLVQIRLGLRFYNNVHLANLRVTHRENSGYT